MKLFAQQLQQGVQAPLVAGIITYQRLPNPNLGTKTLGVPNELWLGRLHLTLRCGLSRPREIRRERGLLLCCKTRQIPFL